MENKKKTKLEIDGIEVHVEFNHETKTDDVYNIIYQPVDGNWGAIALYMSRTGRDFMEDIKTHLLSEICQNN